MAWALNACAEPEQPVHFVPSMPSPRIDYFPSTSEALVESRAAWFDSIRHFSAGDIVPKFSYDDSLDYKYGRYSQGLRICMHAVIVDSLATADFKDSVRANADLFDRVEHWRNGPDSCRGSLYYLVTHHPR
jgi:hypothetical protein